MMNASEIASLASYRACGSGASSGRSRSSRSGYGSSQTTSPSRVGSGGSTSRLGQFMGGRRLADRSAFRQRLVAIRYSQVRSELRCSKPRSPRHADSRVSCTASSASCADPRMR